MPREGRSGTTLTLKRLIRAVARKQGPRKRDCRIYVAGSLLECFAQSLLVSIRTEDVCNALAHSRIDVPSA
ncbi:hypothetical protein AC630_15315 [Bradyrhizobium sp. AS23.2]|nr:hypothetical protein AC630_15315 [Bradyrhizobium sp. AS23.2]